MFKTGLWRIWQRVWLRIRRLQVRVLPRSIFFIWWLGRGQDSSIKVIAYYSLTRSCGAMDNASDYESEDCRFESCQDRYPFFNSLEGDRNGSEGHVAQAQSRQSAKRFSSRWNWDSPTPWAAGECAPHPLVRGGGHTRLRLKGWGSPNSNEGTYTVVLYIYKYFVGASVWLRIRGLKVRVLLGSIFYRRIARNPGWAMLWMLPKNRMAVWYALNGPRLVQ